MGIREWLSCHLGWPRTEHDTERLLGETGLGCKLPDAVIQYRDVQSDPVFRKGLRERLLSEMEETGGGNPD